MLKKPVNLFIYFACVFFSLIISCKEDHEDEPPVVDINVVIEGDKKIKPTGGNDSEHQPDQGIDKSMDGKAETHYHSIWNQSANFPVILEYFFNGTEDIDYILYHTRNGNGNFGELDVYTATVGEPEYKLAGSYDFRMQNVSSRIVFAQQLKQATKIKFAVKSGSGGFVSCSEMEFFQRNVSKKLDEQLLTVFKDITCSELKDGITDEEIKTLPGYFANIAFLLKNNTYDAWEKEFRLRSYQPYSIPEEWAEKLMTKKYSNLDNPTGIYVEAGDTVIVLVGDTRDQALSIQCIGDEQNGSYAQTASSGEIRFLVPGVNKIGFSGKGMLFIMYNTNLTNINAKPVKIHIPAGSGYVSGFFDPKIHKTNDKYKELIEKARYKYFCVRGDKIMFYFHRDKMRQAVPYDILSAIDLWDNIVGWQQELMGIEEVHPAQFNNHIFAISPEGSYMWASDYRIGFAYTYLNNILLYNNVMDAKDNAWGPAHEIGHIHQEAINWPGSSESSNNLFSNYILYKLGKYCSRGSELSALAVARCINNEGWWNMGGVTHQNEDTELHVRMNWQLWNYYHRCGYKSDFWQTLFKLLRDDRIVESDPGAGQLKFAELASRAANENLTEFFERWGFFEPVDAAIEQYGTWNYMVTEAMIRETKSYMAKYPAPKHAFYYLEDRKNGDV
ncbi:MAG: M60 family metallopeptidase, partial [Dysgonamonadaceae bacterium]|nr:M60 family metallopeptidase [Dysgonamonadaceae bacterium]